MFQSRSQTGHGYNEKIGRLARVFIIEFQSRSQTGHGYNGAAADVPVNEP